MKFPGKRKTRHYFPVSEETRTPLKRDLDDEKSVHIIGIDQLIVDIEVHVDDQLLSNYNLKKGQSQIAHEELVEELYQFFKKEDLIVGEFAGGSTGNTLHNYAVLADDHCIALGAINDQIRVGDYAYKYICTTNSHVDLSLLKPCNGAMARAICLITPDKERTFVIGKGIMNQLSAEFVPEKPIATASALLVSAYLTRDEGAPIFGAMMKAVKIANSFEVPVVLSLGTSHIVEQKREFLLSFISKHVDILAGNEEEVSALMNEPDPLLALESVLEFTDMALVTVGKSGLYLGSYCDESLLRRTKDHIHSKSLSEYNKYEYSRPMRLKSCESPQKIFTHINPFMGGPGKIENTNGAGDAALSAVLHDITANDHHHQMVPNSPKHMAKFLTYSSLHQVAKYANRASFEVLNQNSPRLSRGLPEKEDSLEEAYWDK